MYLLDTNIVIFLFKDKFGIAEKLEAVGFDQCSISEITLIELLTGAEKSLRPEYHRKKIGEFVEQVKVLPISNAIDVFAKEKARLEKSGMSISNFDMLIGATAIANELTLVTNNVSHLSRMSNILIENWVSVS